jgi:glycosyltransferase involved in cell wall biosynthesis
MGLIETGGGRKKLVFITTRLFFPPDSGRKVSLYHYCRGLAEVYGYDVYLYSFLESGQTAEGAKKAPGFIKGVEIARPVSDLRKMKNLLFKSLLGKGWPFQCSLYFSAENVKRIRDMVAKIKPDAVIVDMVRLAPYYEAIQGFNCLKVLDLDDLLSRRYERQRSETASKADMMGQYGRGVSSGMRRFLNFKFLKRLILSMESKHVARYEKYYGEAYDSVILVSQKETDELNAILSKPKTVTVTMGCDVAFAGQSSPLTKTSGRLAFVGNLNTAAGADTLDMIVTKVLPLVKSDVKLRVIGQCPDELRGMYGDKPDIEFTGFVDDLQKAVCEAEVFLAPIAYGSGIKTKILEAMGMGMPVVTNACGAEGIVAENGKHFMVCDSFSEIAAQVDYLLVNKEKSSEIAENARQLIMEKYQWKTIWANFAKAGL